MGVNLHLFRLLEDFNPEGDAQQAYLQCVENWRDSRLHPIVTDDAADLLAAELLSPAEGAPGPDVLGRAAWALQQLAGERTQLRKRYMAATGKSWPTSPDDDPAGATRAAAGMKADGFF